MLPREPHAAASTEPEGFIHCVRYAAPGGWLVEWLFVRRDIERIFQFRREKLLSPFREPA